MSGGRLRPPRHSPLHLNRLDTHAGILLGHVEVKLMTRKKQKANGHGEKSEVSKEGESVRMRGRVLAQRGRVRDV